MNSIKSFSELRSHLAESKNRKRIAVANAVDAHSLEAVLMAIEAGIVDAYLVGDSSKIESMLGNVKDELRPYIHIVHRPEVLQATHEAVRMVKEDEADVLMKGLVNTDDILRAILNKETGILTPGSVLSFSAAVEIPKYHKLLFFSDPAVIPYPSLEQRKAMIHYAINTCERFGIKQPKISLVHATEKHNTKLMFMQDYLDILDIAKTGEFGNSIIDGPLDIFLSLDKELGGIKNVPTPILGDSDVLIFPDFVSANVFYKTLPLFAGAEMAGTLYGPQKPCVLTSRSDSTQSKFNSICIACILSK